MEVLREAGVLCVEEPEEAGGLGKTVLLVRYALPATRIAAGESSVSGACGTTSCYASVKFGYACARYWLILTLLSLGRLYKFARSACARIVLSALAGYGMSYWDKICRSCALVAPEVDGL